MALSLTDMVRCLCFSVFDEDDDTTEGERVRNSTIVANPNKIYIIICMCMAISNRCVLHQLEMLNAASTRDAPGKK